MKSIAKSLTKQQGEEQERDGYWRDSGITKATLERILKHWQTIGWVDVSDSPVGTVAVWRNYR